jgi:hypothetical protein
MSLFQKSFNEPLRRTKYFTKEHQVLNIIQKSLVCLCEILGATLWLNTYETTS